MLETIDLKTDETTFTEKQLVEAKEQGDTMALEGFLQHTKSLEKETKKVRKSYNY